MKTKLLLCILFTITFIAIAGTLPQVASGKIERIENFPSKFVTPRNIDVWLPEGYSTSKKYDVLYMHDGQMLFDSTQTWNKQSWDVDKVAAELMNKRVVRNFIVVGIWNGGATRHPDYFPQKPFESLSPIQKEIITKQLQSAGRTNDTFKPISDNYLKFLVTELKPLIDANYSVNTDRAHTFVAGSSMGGLISMYAICEYPSVFGGAVCMSTHWPGIFSVKNNPIPDAFLMYLKTHLPNPKTYKFYFDYGDQTLDALYAPLQKRADSVMKTSGFGSENWQTKFFPGENHSEAAWHKRLRLPLLFLFGK